MKRFIFNDRYVTSETQKDVGKLYTSTSYVLKYVKILDY